jgi:hypothetical protein
VLDKEKAEATVKASWRRLLKRTRDIGRETKERCGGIYKTDSKLKQEEGATEEGVFLYHG